MMSEKRFIYEEEHYNFPVKKRIRDTQNNETYDLRECCDVLNEKQELIEELQEDKAIAEDYANIFEKENVKLRKKLTNYKATVLGFLWIMEENGRISMSEKRFGYGETDLFEWVEDNGEMISTKECVNKLNEQQDTINNLQEVVAELGATLLMNGFEIEINGKDLNELIKDE